MKGVLYLELFGLIFALVSIVIITSKWHQVIPALLIGIIVIIFFSSMPPNNILDIIYNTAVNFDTISLIITVLLITLFGSIMYKTLFLEKLLNSLILLFKSIQFLIAAIPALVGFLAVPGGAVMSAPFVDHLGNRINMAPGYKSGLNIFFRHLIVYFNPISPIIVIVSGINNMGIMPIIKFHFIPVTITIIIALIIINHFWPTQEKTNNNPIVNNTKEKEQGEKGKEWVKEKIGNEKEPIKSALKQLVFYGAPLVTALVLTLLFTVHFIISLSLAILLNVLLDIKTLRTLKDAKIITIIKEDINWNLGLSIFVILLFGNFIKSSGSIPILADIITNSNLPLLMVVICTSILIGFTAGHPLVGSAIVYPIFLPIVGIENTIYISLILNCLYFGYVISPIHLCLIVSNEYFKSKYLESYILLVPLQFLLLASAVVFAIIIL